MGKRIVHICQSVDGALKNWSPKMWHFNGRDNGVTGPELKKHFQFLRFKGIKVIPCGERCEGFSDRTGCPGHYIDQEGEETTIALATEADKPKPAEPQE